MYADEKSRTLKTIPDLTNFLYFTLWCDNYGLIQILFLSKEKQPLRWQKDQLQLWHEIQLLIEGSFVCNFDLHQHQ